MEYKEVCCVGKIMKIGNWLFLLIPIHLFLFVEAAKEWMTERKETGILFKSILIFGIYDYFVVWNVFLNQYK